MKFKIALAGLALLLIAGPTYATVCRNASGGVTDVAYDLSNTFTAANNQIGQEVTLTKNNFINVFAICPAGTTGITTKRSYVTSLPIVETEGNFQYLKLNDYLNGAMSIIDSAAGIFYPPRNYIQMGDHGNVPNQQPFPVYDSNLVFKLKVTRRFINMVLIPRQTMFTVYVTTESGEQLNTPVYTISYSGRVEVPQFCELNVGQVVEFDFGDIGAALFSQAGAGNSPQGVSPQTKTVAIKCTNIDAEAYLSLRLQAEKSSGDIMVSDNPDLGFLVSDGSNNTFTPNDINSKLPFRLDDAATARIPVKAVPVSVTGNKPIEGRFTARGYLRVDYD